jgi:hypothetical protein
MHDRPGKASQLVTHGYGVVTVSRSRNDAGGGNALATASSLGTEISNALFGFTPAGACSSMRKARNAGRLIRWDEALYFFAFYWDVDVRICKKGD